MMRSWLAMVCRVVCRGVWAVVVGMFMFVVTLLSMFVGLGLATVMWRAVVDMGLGTMMALVCAVVVFFVTSAFGVWMVEFRGPAAAPGSRR